MIHLTPVTPDHKHLFSEWLTNDVEGQKELSSYMDFDNWFHRLNPTPRFRWIAYENNQPIGFVDLEKYEDLSASFSFYIAPHERNKGQGKELLRKLAVKAKELDIKELFAGVEESNVPSQRALLAVGFVQDGKDKDGYSVFRLNKLE